jgi:hypothetical protein
MLFGYDSAYKSASRVSFSPLRKRSADPITAATTAILKPELVRHGFQDLSRRRFGRIKDDILHYLDLQLSGYGGKRFCVNYAAISLYSPREHIVLEPGARLAELPRREKWWPGDNHDSADHSMIEVVRLFESIALAFFNKAETTSGYLDILERKRGGSRHHLQFQLACVYAKLRREGAARNALKLAVQLYRDDGRPWCAKCISLCEQLLTALDGGVAQALLATWKEYSIQNLRLAALMSPPNRGL